MAERKINELPPGTASRTHIIPAFKDNTTVTLTVGQLLDLLVDAAPGSLDTLNELAAAIGDDANFAATVTAQLALKANKSDTDIPNLTSKTTPVDADSLRIWDSVALAFRRVTFANLKAALKTYFDTLYSTLTAATQTQQEAATSNAVAVTPGTQRFHPSAAKAFACVTQAGGTYTLATAGSANVASIAKQATGLVRVNWSTAFSAAAYAAIATPQEGGNYSISIQATAVGYVDVGIRNAGTGAAVDIGFSVVVFGDI